MRQYRATETGHARSVESSRRANRRLWAAARWAYANGYDDPPSLRRISEDDE